MRTSSRTTKMELGFFILILLFATLASGRTLSSPDETMLASELKEEQLILDDLKDQIPNLDWMMSTLDERVSWIQSFQKIS
jgi:hypothetical protein